jgi:hypothetical protein
MKRLITKIAAMLIVILKISFRVNLLPVGKQLGIGQGSIDLVGVEPYDVRSCGNSYQSQSSGFDQTPGPGHGDQITPWVQHVSVPEKQKQVTVDGSPSPSCHTSNTYLLLNKVISGPCLI